MMPLPEQEEESKEELLTSLWFSPNAKFVYYKLHDFRTYTNLNRKEHKYDVLIVNQDGSCFKRSEGNFLSMACRSIPVKKNIPVFLYKRDQGLIDALQRRYRIFLLKDEILRLTQIYYMEVEDTPAELYYALTEKYGDELPLKNIFLPLRINSNIKNMNHFELELQTRYMLFLYRFYNRHMHDD